MTITGLSGETYPIESNIITGSFAEFRGNHLHTGIDMSTYNSNLPVVAPVSGHISYIKQDFFGYGKALFLSTDNHIYVFSHLS
ncbi:MAG: M23 family peptidase, partial [bacterium]